MPTALFALVVLLLSLDPSPLFAQSFDEDLELFGTRLGELRMEHRLPGLAVAVVRDHKLAWSSAYGRAYDEIPVTPDTPFWIASVTKPFMGLLFLQLEADGIVDLQDRINDLPDWDEFCGWLVGTPLPFGEDLRCDAPITLDQVLHHTLNGDPGSRFLYNPFMYSRLSRYIAYTYGRDLEAIDQGHNQMAQLLDEYVLQPARMSRNHGKPVGPPEDGRVLRPCPGLWGHAGG